MHLQIHYAILTIAISFGKLAMWQKSFRKKLEWISILQIFQEIYCISTKEILLRFAGCISV